MHNSTNLFSRKYYWLQRSFIEPGITIQQRLTLAPTTSVLLLDHSTYSRTHDTGHNPHLLPFADHPHRQP